MNIAILKNSEVIDTAIFNDLATAREFLTQGIWPGADEVAELPAGFGVGDFYEDGEWQKKEPDPIDPVPQAPTPEERLTAIENALLELI